MVVQILCSYVTLPLYALVTQVGTSMRLTIFNDRIVAALRQWHHTAKKNIKQNHHRAVSLSVTPISSGPGTPTHHYHRTSPLHLLHNHNRSELGSVSTSPTSSNPCQPWDTHSRQLEMGYLGHDTDQPKFVQEGRGPTQHQIDMGQSREFSFDKRQIV